MVGFSSLFSSFSTFFDKSRNVDKISVSYETIVSPLPPIVEENVPVRKSKQDSRWENIKVSGNVPCERSGHSGLLVGDYIYVFGGFNGFECLSDLHRFNTITHEWETVLTSGIRPTGRASYAWTYSEYNKKIYLFGGSGAVFDESNLNKLLEFDIATQQWSVSSVTNNRGPSAGYGQTLNSYGNKLYLFGGTTGHTYSNELYIYDQELLIWEGPVVGTGSIPTPRYKHQAVVNGEYIYIFGGGLYDAPEGAMEVYSLHVPTLKWTKINRQSGELPVARIAHTAVVYENSVYIFGGRDCHHTRQNEVHVYSISSNSWSKFLSEDKSPSVRDFHATAITSNGEMFIFGGSDGIKRNREMHRFTISYKVSSLLVLCLKEIQENKTLYSRAMIMKLPFELRVGIESMNPAMTMVDNEKWFHVKPDLLQDTYVNQKREGLAY